MKSFKFILAAICAFTVLSTTKTVLGQSVSINATGASADAQSILDVSSSTKGVLLPRLTDHSSITPTSGSDDGLMVYDTTTDSYWYWDASANAWREIPNTTTVGLDNTTASNGLTEVGDDIRLGGALTQNPTTIVQGGNKLVFTSSEIDGFSVDGTTFSVDAANNRVGFGTSAPQSTVQLRVNSTGLNVPLLIWNQQFGAVTNNNAVGIGFANEPNDYGAFFKAAVVHERTSAFGVGPLHFLVDEVGDNGSATLAETRMTIYQNGNVGIGDVTPDAKLDVDATTGDLLILAQSGSQRALVDINGNMTISGKMNSSGIEELSDLRFKRNISPLKNALNNLLKLEGVTYNWRVVDFPNKAFDEGLEIGVIAQEVEKIYPEVVSTDSEGYKAVQYSHLVPVLIEAIKEQQYQIRQLNKLVSDMSLLVDSAATGYNDLRAQFEILSGEMFKNQMSGLEDKKKAEERQILESSSVTVRH